MKMRKLLVGLLSAAMLTGTLAGCSQKSAQPDETTAKSEAENVDTETAIADDETDAATDTDTSAASTGEEVVVEFWTAPEQYNLDIWTQYAEQFNSANILMDGKKVTVNVQMMPAQPSSEAGIQNAIATGTIPAISENINRSFAGTLANAQAVYDIAAEDWYQEIVAERQLDDVMPGWEIEGAQYVIPLYVNPITYVWNSKALTELGIGKVPETMADFEAVLSAYNDKQGDLEGNGITHFMYRAELVKTADWWERWFDFEAQYNAFSQGGGLVEGNALTVDEEAAKKVFELYGKMGKSLLTGEISGVWQQETVPVVMGAGLPWDISANKAAGKTYGLDGDYVFGPTLVENEGDTPYCFADSKGLVLYKNENVSDEQHAGAIEFLKYVFTGEGKESFDIDWLETTAMLPVRGDLDTNANLDGYFAENPELKAVSAFVKDGVPCMAHDKMADILTALAEGGLTPYITEQVAGAEIGEVPDAAEYVERAMEAMKAAGELE